MKHEWRKHEKDLYLPKNEPVALDIPEMKFFTIHGQGNPNGEQFPEYVSALYAASYAIRMSPKQGKAPDTYREYTVYPLEGVWDLTQEAKDRSSGEFTKEDFVFTLMIRQPDFVEESFAEEMLEFVRKKKPHPLLDQVRFETMTEGPCVQMLHLGPYDDEPASFARMEAFATENHLTRLSKLHREIYLTDARKTAPEKLKTVLRFRVA